MPPDKLYTPSYGSSWALVVGVNSYQLAPPLLYACSDADTIARLLTKRFAFPVEQITILKDDAATRDAVRKAFLRLAGVCGEDDRVVVFFAGHGCTRRGHAGEVGFLVPVDGDPADLAAL